MPAEDPRQDKTPGEKRLDEYIDGLFWISVFGLGFVIGGTVLPAKFGVRDLIVLGYAVLSTIVFLINFGVSMWGCTQRFALERQANDATRTRDA